MLTDKSQNSSFILGIMGNISTQKVKNNECTAVTQKKKQTIVKVIQHQKLFFFFFILETNIFQIKSFPS